MGFETQEEAERFAESVEFRADQAKEEKMLAKACCEETPCQWGDHPCERKRVPSSEQTLDTITRSAEAGIVSVKAAIQAAYVLGQFDGKLEMAKVGTKLLKDAAVVTAPFDEEKVKRGAEVLRSLKEPKTR